MKRKKGRRNHITPFAEYDENKEAYGQSSESLDKGLLERSREKFWTRYFVKWTKSIRSCSCTIRRDMI